MTSPLLKSFVHRRRGMARGAPRDIPREVLLGARRW
jgi:hypothetical protein